MSDIIANAKQLHLSGVRCKVSPIEVRRVTKWEVME